MPTITYRVDGTEQSAELPANRKEKLRVGRNEDNDLSIADASVSGQHGEFIAKKNGLYRFVDLGSTNGSKLNGKELHDDILYNGDRVELGNVSITIHSEVQRPQNSNQATETIIANSSDSELKAIPSKPSGTSLQTSFGAKTPSKNKTTSLLITLSVFSLLTLLLASVYSFIKLSN